MSSSTPPPPPSDPTTTPTPKSDSTTKKPPPLPWTHQETISLIESYRDKWYSLNRGHLKSSQWDQVAEAVPSKTPTQCRHKIEKLRKRYRSELHKPFPYTWQYFQIMHQMEQGPLNPTPISALPRDPPNNHDSEDDGDDDDEEDEEWSGSKARSVKNAAGTSGSGGSAGGRNLRDRKRKSYYSDAALLDDESSDDDDDEEDEDMYGTNKYTSRDKYAGDADGDGDEDVEMELAREIKGFAESFVRMENRKIDMMRDTERLRMEMERKKMDMIVQAQRKIVHTIGQVFGTT